MKSVSPSEFGKAQCVRLRHLRAGQVHAADAFDWELGLAGLYVVAAAPAGPPPALIQCMVRSVRLPNRRRHGYGYPTAVYSRQARN